MSLLPQPQVTEVILQRSKLMATLCVTSGSEDVVGSVTVPLRWKPAETGGPELMLTSHGGREAVALALAWALAALKGSRPSQAHQAPGSQAPGDGPLGTGPWGTPLQAVRPPKGRFPNTGGLPTLVQTP